MTKNYKPNPKSLNPDWIRSLANPNDYPAATISEMRQGLLDAADAIEQLQVERARMIKEHKALTHG